mgnify:CR=1 FL=1
MLSCHGLKEGRFQTIRSTGIPSCSGNTCGVKMISGASAEKHSRFTLVIDSFKIDALQATYGIQAEIVLSGKEWPPVQVVIEKTVHPRYEHRSLRDLGEFAIKQRNFGTGDCSAPTITGVDQSRVSETTWNRATKATDQPSKTLPEVQRSKIKAVCMDMWHGYDASTERNALNARNVHDRCHIAKYLNEAVDKVRRADHRNLQRVGDDRLKGVRQILLFNPENLDQEEDKELNAPRKIAPTTGPAWVLKELVRLLLPEGDTVGGRAFSDFCAHLRPKQTQNVFVHVSLKFPDLVQDRLQLHLAGSQSWTFVSNSIMTDPRDVFLQKLRKSSFLDLQ